MYGNEKGFTMIEMMIVMVIIAVLVAGGVAFYQGNIEKTKVTKARAQISTMQAALDVYYAESGEYPCGSGDEFKASMLGAGLELAGEQTEVDSDGYWALKVEDPWGKFYQYHSIDDDGKNYCVSTGWRGEKGGNAVYGKGIEGISSEPKMGPPDETT